MSLLRLGYKDGKFHPSLYSLSCPLLFILMQPTSCCDLPKKRSLWVRLGPETWEPFLELLHLSQTSPWARGYKETMRLKITACVFPVGENYVHMCKVALCPTLCNPMDCIPPGSSVHGILQPRIPKWVAKLSFKGSSPPGVKPRSPAVPALKADFFFLFTAEPK